MFEANIIDSPDAAALMDELVSHAALSLRSGDSFVSQDGARGTFGISRIAFAPLASTGTVRPIDLDDRNTMPSSSTCASQRLTTVSPSFMSLQTSPIPRPCTRIICTTCSQKLASKALRFVFATFTTHVVSTFVCVRNNSIRTVREKLVRGTPRQAHS